MITNSHQQHHRKLLTDIRVHLRPSMPENRIRTLLNFRNISKDRTNPKGQYLKKRNSSYTLLIYSQIVRIVRIDIVSALYLPLGPTKYCVSVYRDRRVTERELEIQKDNHHLIQRCISSDYRRRFNSTGHARPSDLNTSSQCISKPPFELASLNRKNRIDFMERITVQNNNLLKRIISQKSKYKISEVKQRSIRRHTRIRTQPNELSEKRQSINRLEVVPGVPDDFSHRSIVFKQYGHLGDSSKPAYVQISHSETFYYVCLELLVSGTIYKVRLVRETGRHLLSLIEKNPDMLLKNWIQKERRSNSVYNLNGTCSRNGNSIGLYSKSQYYLVIAFHPFVRRYKFREVLSKLDWPDQRDDFNSYPIKTGLHFREKQHSRDLKDSYKSEGRALDREKAKFNEEINLMARDMEEKLYKKFVNGISSSESSEEEGESEEWGRIVNNKQYLSPQKATAEEQQEL